MKTEWKSFKGVAWNACDLISCKQAVEILAGKGVCEEVIFALDFGGLDVTGVLEEMI